MAAIQTRVLKLYDAVSSTRKHLRVFTAAEGGAAHCQVVRSVSNECREMSVE
jgi:hypothetical protein